MFDEPSTAMWFKSSDNNTVGARVSWTYNPIPFSQLAFFAALFFYYLFFLCKKIVIRYSALCMTVGMLGIVVYAQTRATWLAIIFIIPILFIFIKQLRWILLSGFLSVVIMVLAVFPDSGLVQRLYSIQDTESNSNSYRLEHWKANIKLSIDNPLIGAGYAENRKQEVLEPYLYRFTDDEAVLYGHPHNEYLDVLSGMGYPALILFLGIMLLPLTMALRLLRPIWFSQYMQLLWPSYAKRKSKIPLKILTELQSILIALTLSYLVFILIVACFDKITLTLWSTIIFCWVVIFYYDYIVYHAEQKPLNNTVFPT